ncbi:MAG: ribosome biogenesis GTP-binding protein YihA/YsxC [Elusimicrobiota bacterium]|jgi:GTP-binding protein
MKSNLKNAHFLLSEADPRQIEPSRSETAFVGRSNCGKSSVLNALCHQKKIARVSQTPGRTRTINVYETGHLTWLVDLPGYGFAVGPIESRQAWSDMIEGYLTGRPSLRCVFLIVDAKVGATPLDQKMAHWLRVQALPFRVLANKADQVRASRQSAQRQQIASALHIDAREIAWISAREGDGIQTLRQDVIALLDRPSEKGSD